MATTLHKPLGNSVTENEWQSLLQGMERLSEWFWFLLSFLLFIVLGPFSAPIVLIALIKLGLEDNDHPEPQSIG